MSSSRVHPAPSSIEASFLVRSSKLTRSLVEEFREDLKHSTRAIRVVSTECLISQLRVFSYRSYRAHDRVSSENSK